MTVNTQRAFEAPPAPARNVNLAVLAKALGHPARLGIIAMLHEKQTCIGCDIVDAIGLAQSTTSEHLRILKAAGIITGEIDPPRVCYSLNAEVLNPLRGFLDEIANTSAKGRQNRTKNKGRT
jgi:DNA-binding transcriptional ArsR family regulator